MSSSSGYVVGWTCPGLASVCKGAVSSCGTKLKKGGWKAQIPVGTDTGDCVLVVSRAVEVRHDATQRWVSGRQVQGIDNCEQWRFDLDGKTMPWRLDAWNIACPVRSKAKRLAQQEEAAMVDVEASWPSDPHHPTHQHHRKPGMHCGPPLRRYNGGRSSSGPNGRQPDEVSCASSLHGRRASHWAAILEPQLG